ncbi:hypothetical protein MPEAHAMD_6505 [Methylobacterium frigidaeris]|uniref:Transposase IS66 central domain-containing protein n=1 Tax=Methylobacterium frigidaeris TaxID=2038277 RepID=A0AA37M7U8_9HYPH|nr:hypothetical protein MPEAHAMD_6505 [Methylobacterium frigidaeris]
MRRARDQLLTFAAFPGKVDVTNNACERALRSAVIQRKMTNGYRAMWAAQGEADVRTVIATAALRTKVTPFATLLATITACRDVAPARAPLPHLLRGWAHARYAAANSRPRRRPTSAWCSGRNYSGVRSVAA